MMNTRISILLLVVVAAVSCEKIKSLTARAGAVVQEKIAAKAGSGKSSAVDVELQKLVDQNADGAVFRRDLEFPGHLEVRVTRRAEMSGKFYQTSAIEVRTDLPKGTATQVTKFEREGDQLRYTLEQADFVAAGSEEEKGKKKAAPKPVAGTKGGSSAPSPRPVAFRRSGAGWGADSRVDFRAVSLAQELSTGFESLLIDNGLASRSQWFGKRRFKVGDELVVTGDALPMLLAGDAQGALTLKLESFEPVEGHPCAVFSVKGNYQRKAFPDFEGRRSDEDVTIQSGKYWLSLIYPLLLKEELQTIQTIKTGGQGGLVTRGQGAIRVSVTRAWKRMIP
jgi:hypothetical protein